MGDALAFILELIIESVFSFGGNGESRLLGDTIGCLGGSVLYAMTGGRLDLENHDWRAICFGGLMLIAGLTLGGLLLVFGVRLALNQ
jgi:hypothetical protein